VKHPKKEVREALEEILKDPWWRLEPGGHWGVLLCGHRQRGGCSLPVNGTPENPGGHARWLLREVLKCPHRGSSKEEAR